jgi:hypothetical protein
MACSAKSGIAPWLYAAGIVLLVAYADAVTKRAYAETFSLVCVYQGGQTDSYVIDTNGTITYAEKGFLYPAKVSSTTIKWHERLKVNGKVSYTDYTINRVSGELKCEPASHQTSYCQSGATCHKASERPF